MLCCAEDICANCGGAHQAVRGAKVILAGSARPGQRAGDIQHTAANLSTLLAVTDVCWRASGLRHSNSSKVVTEVTAIAAKWSRK